MSKVNINKLKFDEVGGFEKFMKKKRAPKDELDSSKKRKFK